MDLSIKDRMHTLLKTAAILAAGSLLAACGAEDFTGAYRVNVPGIKSMMVLDIHGERVEVFAETGDGRIIPGPKLNASTKGRKLLVDDTHSGERLVFTRNIDERSLDCLNCKAFGLKDDMLWKYDPKGPYDLSQMLADQASKDKEVLQAEAESAKKREAEQARRFQEAKKLDPYEGDWVFQRTSNQDPLSIMTISRKSQIKRWSFTYEGMDLLRHDVPGFELQAGGLQIGNDASSHLYSLSGDNKIMTCDDCSKPQRWVKSDPKKDLSDRDYARQMAGRP